VSLELIAVAGDPAEINTGFLEPNAAEEIDDIRGTAAGGSSPIASGPGITTTGAGRPLGCCTGGGLDDSVPIGVRFFGRAIAGSTGSGLISSTSSTDITGIGAGFDRAGCVAGFDAGRGCCAGGDEETNGLEAGCLDWGDTLGPKGMNVGFAEGAGLDSRGVVMNGFG